jgi:hypothetical protein
MPGFPAIPLTLPFGYLNTNNSCWLNAMINRLQAVPPFVAQLGAWIATLDARPPALCASFLLNTEVTEWKVNLVCVLFDLLVTVAAVEAGTLRLSTSLDVYIHTLLTGLRRTFETYATLELYTMPQAPNGSRAATSLVDSHNAFEWLRTTIDPVLHCVITTMALVNPFDTYTFTSNRQTVCLNPIQEPQIHPLRFLKPDPSHCILLGLPLFGEQFKAVTFRDLLDEYFRVEHLTSTRKYKCGVCESLQDAHTQLQLQFLPQQPQVLEFHISRWVQNPITTLFEKNAIPVTAVPMIFQFVDSLQNSRIFELVSQIQHINSPRHYVDFRKHRGTWYRCDDSSVVPCGTAAVQRAEASTLTYLEITELGTLAQIHQLPVFSYLQNQ